MNLFFREYWNLRSRPKKEEDPVVEPIEPVQSQPFAPANQNSDSVLSFENLSVSYNSDKGVIQAVKNVSLDIQRGEIFALIGPSSCGKSTLLKSSNRMLNKNAIVTGNVRYNNQDVYSISDVVDVRKMFGYVAQKAQPFSHLNIRDDVTYAAVHIHGLINNNKRERRELAEELLKKVGLWDQVEKDFEKKSGANLSGGQQQRLCIARAANE